jgi:DNA-binding NarL/FixJ family response regulator
VVYLPFQGPFVRVLIADDHTLVRAGIRRLIETHVDIEVVAEAKNAQEVLDLVAVHRPDLALIDLEMPGRSGLEIIAELRERYPEMAVVIMSMHADLAYVRTALDRGATGFLVKEAAPAELEVALRAAHAGQIFLSPKISSGMVDVLMRRSGTDTSLLSQRQTEILTLLGHGKATKEIAADLHISIKTVETHRARMMETLGLRRANDLLRFAIKHSLHA